MPKARGEVLAELVAGAHLQRLAVAHHRFACERVGGARETFARGLESDDDRHREHVDHEVLVDLVEDADRVVARVHLRRVRGVTLLPEELAGAQEEARAQLPAHDVRPLVEEQRKVAVALDPLGHELADDGLARRSHDDRLVELLAAGDGDHRQLGAEALDVLGLPLEVRLGDEQREVGVLGARRP